MKIREGIELWLLKKNGDRLQTLLLRRRQGLYEPFWQPVTGGIEPGETPAEAAAREAFEETGLAELPKSGLLKLVEGQEIVLEKLSTLWRATVFAAVLEADFEVKISDEHDGFGWFSLAEARSMLYWPANLSNLERLIERLGSAARN